MAEAAATARRGVVEDVAHAARHPAAAACAAHSCLPEVAGRPATSVLGTTLEYGPRSANAKGTSEADVGW